MKQRLIITLCAALAASSALNARADDTFLAEAKAYTAQATKEISSILVYGEVWGVGD
jgi:ribose transport system substrate-binding protein